MQDRYYLLMQKGLPIDVFSLEINAISAAKERSIPGYPATVLAVLPQQLELEFPVEDTVRDAKPLCEYCRGDYYLQDNCTQC